MGGYLKLSAFVATCELCEWVQVEIDVFIPYRKYQVKPHPLHGFQEVVLLPYLIEFFFFWYHQNKSSESKVKFRQ